MKAIYCNGSYYQYPDGVMTMDTLMDYVQSQGNRYIPLTRYETENCVRPYFIREETKVVYLNFSQISEIEESEIHVVDKEDYEDRLAECVDAVCRYCVHYTDDSAEDNLKGHRDKINLDGECFFKQPV